MEINNGVWMIAHLKIYLFALLLGDCFGVCRGALESLAAGQPRVAGPALSEDDQSLFFCEAHKTFLCESAVCCACPGALMGFSYFFPYSIPVVFSSPSHISPRCLQKEAAAAAKRERKQELRLRNPRMHIS